MNVFLVVYCESTLVCLKYSYESSVCKWFYSNKVVVEVQNDGDLHRDGGKVVG